MKKLINKYQISKYKCFINGLIFASIALIAITLCILRISNHSMNKIEIILPFCIAITSISMGCVSMFHNNISANKKLKNT